jgi:hypothetical protein
MTIRFGFNPSSLLNVAGYKYIGNGFIRYVNDFGDRWHIRILGGDVIDIHFDHAEYGGHKANSFKRGTEEEIKRIKNYLK